MGFNKRIVSKEQILYNKNQKKTLKEIFKSDSVITTDQFSTKCLDLYLKGFSDEEIFKQLENVN